MFSLAKHNNLNIVIEGHCDERGSEEYNLSLGESRAEQVKAALIQGNQPRADQDHQLRQGTAVLFLRKNEACWQQNRCAHFAHA